MASDLPLGDALLQEPLGTARVPLGADLPTMVNENLRNLAGAAHPGGLSFSAGLACELILTTHSERIGERLTRHNLSGF